MFFRAKKLKKRLYPFSKFSQQRKWILGVCVVAIFIVAQFLFLQQLMAKRLASYGYGYQYGHYGYGYQLSSALPKAPTGLTVTGVSGSSISLSWNAVTEAMDDTLISEGGGSIIYYTIYRSSTADGFYEARASVNLINWTETDLPQETTFYYKVTATDDNYNASAESGYVSGTTLDIIPPGSVTNFSATSGDEQIVLTWTNPTDADFAGTKVLRKTGGYPSSPTDGTVVYNGTGTSKTDTGLTNGVRYYYTSFAYDEVPNYSSAVASARDYTTPRDIISPSPVTNFKAKAQDRAIKLSWTNPGGDFAGTKVLRRTNRYPNTSTDGAVVYNGTGTSYKDTGLTNGIRYYYSAFAYDEVPNYSSRARALAVPRDITAPGKVRNLSAKAGDRYIKLTWKNPDADFKGVRILRRTNRYPKNVTDGTLVYKGKGTSYKDTGLTNGIRYYYTAFAYDEVPNYSSPVCTGAIPKLPEKKLALITGVGPGGGPHIRGFDKDGNPTSLSFFAYHPDFKGGIDVASGDVDGDGKDEIVVGAGKGGGPHIRIFNRSGKLLGQFFAYHPDFRGGVQVVLGDLNGDGKKEIIAGAGIGGGPHIRVFDYKGKLLLQFFAYHPDFRGGVNVAAGDINGDGKDEIIAGAGFGGGPHVRVFDQAGRFTGWDMFPFHPDFRGGVKVALGDVDGDGRDEIGVCQASHGEAWCKVYKYNKAHTILGEWLAYPRGVECGADIDMFDIDSDARAEVLTGAGMGGGPQVRAFEANGTPKSLSFFAYDPTFRGGVNVAGGEF